MRKIAKSVLEFMAFFLPFLLDLYYGIVVYGNRSSTDDGLYYSSGLIYVEQGIMKGNLTAFLVQCEQPPLAKILMVIPQLILSFFGVPVASEIAPRVFERLFSSVCLGLICLATYKIGNRLRDYRSGALAWLLTVAQFFIIPYEVWLRTSIGLAEINGARLVFSAGAGIIPYFLLCTTELSSIFFICLSVYYLLDPDKKWNLTKAGVCYGFACLTKFSAIPILPAISFFWHLYKTRELRDAALKTSRFILIGLIILFLGNPVFWKIDLFSVFLSRFNLPETRHTSNFPWLILKNLFWDQDEGRRWISYSLLSIWQYPVSLYIESWLLQSFIFLFLYMSLRRKTLSDAQVMPLIWFSVIYCLFGLDVKLAQVEPYADQFFPPLSLFCSISLLTLLDENMKLAEQKRV